VVKGTLSHIIKTTPVRRIPGVEIKLSAFITSQELAVTGQIHVPATLLLGENYR
jgi:hypothetical protein